MYADVFIAGFGGQGVLLIGNIVAFAAIREGRNASFFPVYGAEKRGGAATCTVVITDREVESPVVGRPGVALLLNAVSMQKYFDRVRPGGFCLINSSLVEEDGSRHPELEILRLPLNEMAMEAGDARLLNMIALGAYACRTGAVSLPGIKQALVEVIPERNHRFIPLNERAIDLGAEAAKK